MRPWGTGSSPTLRDGQSTIAKVVQGVARRRTEWERGKELGRSAAARPLPVRPCFYQLLRRPRAAHCTALAGTASTNFHGDLGFKPWSATERRDQKAGSSRGAAVSSFGGRSRSRLQFDGHGPKILAQPFEAFGSSLVLREARGSRTEREQGFLGAKNGPEKDGRAEATRPSEVLAPWVPSVAGRSVRAATQTAALSV